ncbi:MAG TPA: aldehyde dehydrogenase, partial [Halobacteria archaeon]|nr:aldehyde dehydrogenase [Halobacteria archaeon]
WNVPFWQMALKLPSALISGNTVVFKPASQTPLSALWIAKMFEDAGLPKGALNVITGPGSVVGAELAKSDKVDHIAFTGETTTGKEIVQNATGNLKKVTLELGGKSPNIIFDDLPIEEAAEMAVLGISLGNGEICFAGTRALVQDTIYDDVCKKAAEIYGSLKIGSALSAETTVGPLVTEEQMNKVLGYIESGKDEGATLLCGGYRLQEGEFKDGFFVAPTVFSNVSNDMKIAQEEIFGPVLSIIPFSTEEEAIEVANNTIYGLAGGVMTNDKERALRVAKKLKAGNIYLNEWHVIACDMPFGGYKQSGWGRMGGSNGVAEFMQIKSIYMDWEGIGSSIMKNLLLSGRKSE